MFCHSMEKYSQGFKKGLPQTKVVVGDRTPDRNLLIRAKTDLKGVYIKLKIDIFSS